MGCGVQLATKVFVGKTFFKLEGICVYASPRSLRFGMNFNLALCFALWECILELKLGNIDSCQYFIVSTLAEVNGS